MRLEGILGFRVKVVERAGASLRNTFPNTNPWRGEHCSRGECVTCNQTAEERPACTQRNLVYENICTECNPEALKKGELKQVNLEVPSVYVGETARSVQERALEHWASFKNKESDSHFYKHWVLHHNSVGEPKFIMKIVHFHRSALSRQVGEAIRIFKRGGAVLNSKTEYNRCSITRLSLEQAEKEQEPMGEEDLTTDWSEKLLAGWDQRERQTRQGLGRASLTFGQDLKRKEFEKVEGRRKKIMKCDII